MDVSQTVAGGGIVGIVTAVAGYFTQRAASKAAARNVETTSRTELEDKAYARAEGILERTIARLEEELEDERRERAEETGRLRSRLADDERQIRELGVQLGEERLARATHTEIIHREQADQARRIERLRAEGDQWRRIARSIARWASHLRDEVRALGGEPEDPPGELMTLQAVDAAEEHDGRGPAE